MCLQYPIGRLSDRYDRRLVILLLGAVLALLALLMVLLPTSWREPLMGGWCSCWAAWRSPSTP